MKPLKRIYIIFSSYGFAVVMILLMFMLTLLGTLEQAEYGLYQVQKKYFESLFLVHMLGVVPIPLPGGFLVMSLFSINLILGGLVRIRKNLRKPGIIITHLGILLILGGGLVTFKFSDRGYMRMYETDVLSEFQSFDEWTVEIAQPGVSKDVLTIPREQFMDLKGNKSRTFHSDLVPFEITLSGYALNSRTIPVGPAIADTVKSADGYFLQTEPDAKEAGANAPGLYASIKIAGSDEVTERILWGWAEHPATIRCEGAVYTIDLGHRRFSLPFSIVLDKFTRELHPGTQMAASYSSEVTKVEGASNEKIRIWMNHPLRYQGYTLFQQSWGPPNAPPGTPLYSQFEVVRNPADHIPLYACIIISIGLLIHFVQKLSKHIVSENKRRMA